MVHEGRPPGVHMPGPSFRPIIVATVVAVIFFGLVFGGWLLMAGIVMPITASSAGCATPDASTAWPSRPTGPATSNAPRSALPDRHASPSSGLLFVLAIILNSGLIPPAGAEGRRRVAARRAAGRPVRHPREPSGAGGAVGARPATW